MATSAIRIEGRPEVERAFRESDKDTLKGLRKELRQAAKIVAMDARARFAPVDSHSAMGMRPRVRSGLLSSAEQSRRRTTGQHPQYGVMQMRLALLPALEAKRDEVIQRVDRMLDDVANRNGW